LEHQKTPNKAMKTNNSIPAAYVIPGLKQYENLTKELILDAVCKVMDTTELLLFQRSRRRESVEARQIYFYFLRKILRWSYLRIGRTYEYNHATVIHAVKSVESHFECEPEYQQVIRLIEHKFRQSLSPQQKVTS